MIPTPTRAIVSYLHSLALGLALGVTVHAEEAKQHYDLTAGDAVTTFRQFSDVSGKEILYSADAVRGVQTNAVHGDFTPIEALNLMVRGTPLIVVHNEKTDALGVRREPASVDPRSAVPPVSEAPPPLPRAPPLPANQLVRLDPFEVQTTADTSYGALNSNSIVRFNTELDKAPVSADVMTAAFMQDVDVTTIDSMLTGYAGGVGMAFGNPPGQAAATQPGDRNNTTGFTVRGLNAGPIRLNGFVTEASNFATTTNFDVQRVEVIHGPQGLLYGPGGGGGTIVATTDQAVFGQDSGSVAERIDQFGSRRAVLKLNGSDGWVAATVDLMYEDNRYSRLFFSQNNVGYYEQLAFRLPLNTTLREDFSYTRENQTGGGGGPPTVNFGSVAADPRNGQNLAYLLFTNRIGATNPATGQPFSKYGAIDNGIPSWSNIYDGYAGMENWEIAAAYNLDISADTVWTKWLSTNIAFNYNRINDQLGPGGVNTLYAPGVNPNPFPNDWAVNYTPSMSVNNRRHKNFRADGLLTNDFLDERIKSQTNFGFDFQRQGAGGVTDDYYLSDANGNETLSSSISNLGRTTVPAQWWPVTNGPVFQTPVNVARGAPIFYSPQNKQYYVKQIQDASSPAFVTPSNPLGLASYVPGTGIAASAYPEANYQKEITSSGLFLANFTSWWHDLFNTLVGYRYTYTANHIPNTGVATYGVYDTSRFGAPSYNVGLDGRINSWLRWYTDYSANYQVVNGDTDFYGQLVDESFGRAGEVGLKFTPLESRISGSFDYYVNDEQDYAVNSGGAGSIQAQINPAGLNGMYQGPAGTAAPYGTYFDENRRAQGLELNLAASPVSNWRISLKASAQSGTVESNVSYGILYNDQFKTDGNGGVTYANGSPFLVPATPGTNISSLNSPVNPNTSILSGVPTVQLTTAMIGNPSSPYYAWQGGQVTPAGNILSTSNVGRVLENFNVPGQGSALTGAVGLPIKDIQYAWPDPNNTGGNVVVAKQGTPTVGYPVYGITLVNAYQFSQGPLKGFGAVLVLNDQWKWRTFLYNTPAPGPQQVLWGQNSLGVQINLNPYYEHKFGRILWRTQLDITNLTNHYTVELFPNNGSGFTNPNNLNVRWDNQPRSYAWSNTFKF